MPVKAGQHVNISKTLYRTVTITQPHTDKQQHRHILAFPYIYYHPSASVKAHLQTIVLVCTTCNSLDN